MNLSHSKISTFEDCGMKFKYRYINGYYPKKDSANLEFGKAVHGALEMLFMREEDPVKNFLDSWKKLEGADLDYSRYDNWEKLMDVGTTLMNDFVNNEYEKFIETLAVENWLKFELDPSCTFYGRGDWVGKVVTPDGELVTAIVDFKTSGRKYDENKVHFNDQLTAYHFAGHRYSFDIDKVAYLVFIKKKSPELQWLFADRTEDQERDYLEKINEDYEQIMAGKFYRKYGMSCKWCDYQPLCLRDEQKVREELIVRINDDTVLTPGAEHILENCPYDVQPMDYVQSFVDDNKIEGNFIFSVRKNYNNRTQWFTYELEGTELRRIYQKEEREVA